MSRIYIDETKEGLSPSQLPRRDRRVAMGQETVPIRSQQQGKASQHFPFDKVKSIQFCIDGAIGLPLSTTATRVTARLLSHDRSQIGEPSAPSYCDIESEAFAPKFDLHMGWRANTLLPTTTIVCRIDTLERPSLLPKCIGFAALKLCVDINGEQPGPKPNGQIFLNNGMFMLPIVYGRVPTENFLTEALMDRLPHMHGAFLKVRLFDPLTETESEVKGPDSSRLPQVPYINNSNFIPITSILATLISSMPYSADSIRQLPISEAIMNDVMKGALIAEGEKKIVSRQCIEWMANVFPALKQKIPLLDPRYMMKYENKLGVFCALDMLYNMPPRPNILESAKQALGASARGGIFRDKIYDNHIKYYKSYFRYLPGSMDLKSRDASLDNVADLIMDDASLELDQESFEYCPVYLDEFSRTVGIDLTPNACLLVVVTAVDILTSEKLAASSEGYRNIKGKSRSNGIYDTHNKADDETAFKLRGLVGTYFGTADANSVWWGLLPLLSETPFQKQPKSPATNLTALFNPDNTGSAFQTPMKGAGTRSSVDWSASRSKVVIDGSKSGSYVNELSSPVSVYFVNAGTHQVPLFTGFPPADMLRAPNPMAWLLSNLSLDGIRAEVAKPSSSSSCCCSANSLDVVEVDTSRKAAAKKKLQAIPTLSLSPGASAFVSIVDPRLRQFSNDSLSKDSSVTVREEALNRILRAKFQKFRNSKKEKDDDIRRRDAAYSMFKFQPDKLKGPRMYKEAIPSSIFTGTLMREVNQEFVNIISEAD